MSVCRDYSVERCPRTVPSRATDKPATGPVERITADDAVVQLEGKVGSTPGDLLTVTPTVAGSPLKPRRCRTSTSCSDTRCGSNAIVHGRRICPRRRSRRRSSPSTGSHGAPTAAPGSSRSCTTCVRTGGGRRGAWSSTRMSRSELAHIVPFVPPVPDRLTDEDMLLALRRLPAHHQEIILLCDVEEMTYKEIAAALAIPIGTVMSRLHRGRELLRNSVGTPGRHDQWLCGAGRRGALDHAMPRRARVGRFLPQRPAAGRDQSSAGPPSRDLSRLSRGDRPTGVRSGTRCVPRGRGPTSWHPRPEFAAELAATLRPVSVAPCHAARCCNRGGPWQPV